MGTKEKKWLKPLIAVVVAVVIIVAAITGIKSYMASRSVVLTMDDVMTTVTALKSYLRVIAAAIVLAIIVCIAAVKLKKPIRSLVRGEALVAVLLVIVVVVNMICMGPEYSLINNALGDTYLLTDDTIAKSEELVKDIANEGMVLLKNDDHALPLTDVTKLNVFGWSSVSPVYGGTGSGSVDESTCVTLLQGLEDAGFELNTEISDFYKAFRDTRPVVAMGGQDWTIPEPTMDEYESAGIFDSAREFSDTAVVVIARTGGENADLPTSISDEDTFQVGENALFGGTGVRYSEYADDIDPSKSYLE